MLPLLGTNSLATYFVLGLAPRLVAASSGWHFVQNGTSGVVALESMVVSDNLVIFFDRATNDPLQVNGHTAWGSLYNLETNTASALDLKTDSFCASGGFLSNGTMVSFIASAPTAMASSSIGQRWRQHPCHSTSIWWSDGNPNLGTLWWSQWKRLLVVRRPRDFTPSGNPLVPLKSENLRWLSGKSSPICFRLKSYRERYRWF